MKGLYADHGHFYTVLDELRVSFNTSRLRKTQIERDTNLLRQVLQQLLQTMLHNKTGNNVSADTINDILRNISIGMKDDIQDPITRPRIRLVTPHVRGHAVDSPVMG